MRKGWVGAPIKQGKGHISKGKRALVRTFKGTRVKVKKMKGLLSDITRGTYENGTVALIMKLKGHLLKKKGTCQI